MGSSPGLVPFSSYLEDFGKDESNLAVRQRSGSGEQIDDVLNSFVGAVVGRFKLAIWAVLRVGTMVEAVLDKTSLTWRP